MLTLASLFSKMLISVQNTNIIDTSAPSDMAFKVAMQWLHRALLVLRLDVRLIVQVICVDTEALTRIT